VQSGNDRNHAKGCVLRRPDDRSTSQKLKKRGLSPFPQFLPRHANLGVSAYLKSVLRWGCEKPARARKRGGPIGVQICVLIPARALTRIIQCATKARRTSGCKIHPSKRRFTSVATHTAKAEAVGTMSPFGEISKRPGRNASES